MSAFSDALKDLEAALGREPTKDEILGLLSLESSSETEPESLEPPEAEFDEGRLVEVRAGSQSFRISQLPRVENDAAVDDAGDPIYLYEPAGDGVQRIG